MTYEITCVKCATETKRELRQITPRLTESNYIMLKTVKKPTKAEIARKRNNNATIRAVKLAERTDLVQARVQYAKDEQKTAETRGAYAIHLNRAFKFTRDNGGYHWTEIADSKNAKHPESNLHSVWKAIEAERVSFVTILESGPKAHTNAAQVWKRFKESSYKLDFPNTKRAPRQAKLPADNAKAKLLAAYYSVAKETVQSADDEKLVRIIGKALAEAGFDLAKVNQKLGG